MKRVTILLIAAILITVLSSCSNAITDKKSTELSQEDVFLIGSYFLDSPFSFNSEVSEEDTKYTDGKKVNDKKVELNFDNMEITYVESINKKYSKSIIDLYKSNKRTYQYDAKNDSIIAFIFASDIEGNYYFPENYNVKKEEIDIETAKQLSIEFLKKYENPDEYVLTRSYGDVEYCNYYEFNYKKYKYGVAVKSISIMMDKCGNVTMYASTPDSEYVDVDIPDFADEFYIEGAKKRIDKIINGDVYWKDKDNIREFKDYKVIQKKLCYLNQYESYAIDYSVGFIVVNKDDTEYESGLQFFYLLNQK